MARATKAAARPKKKTVRLKRRASLWELMPTNKGWHGAHYYVHYEIETKDWLNVIKEYIKKNYDKQIVSAINKLPDWKVGGKSHWACAVYCEQHHPELLTHYKGKVDGWIRELAEEGAKIVEEKKAEEKTKKNVYVPTIQERIREQAQLACEAIDEWADIRITDPKNFDIDGFNFVKHFIDHKTTQAHARKIKSWYEPELQEAYTVRDMPTPAQIKKIKNDADRDIAEQLREGYGHMKKAEIKLWIETLEKIITACDMVIDKAKATRKPRVKKAPSKEKLVAKVKYCKEDSKLSLVSANPLEMLDAVEIWVYNTKTRKLGKYVADEYQKTMTVKGTTLLGYDEHKSIQKTLRKPDETLKEFKKAGKVALRKFMDDIKTTDIKLNGRLNSDTIILKCI